MKSIKEIVVRRKLKKQGGFTAIELMFALGVIAVGTVALVLASRANSNKQNANVMVADVSALVQNIQSSFASSSDGFTGLDNTSAISMKLVPGDLLVKTGSDTINSKFPGGTVEIKVGDNNDTFTITYSNVPDSVCNSVVTTLGGAAFLNITINGTPVYDTASQLKLNPVTVGQSCAASSGIATIAFTAS